jgi:hypothetical protein
MSTTLSAIQPKINYSWFVNVCLFFVWQDEQETKRRLASTDAREIQKFYEQYCRKYLEEYDEKRKP